MLFFLPVVAVLKCAAAVADHFIFIAGHNYLFGVTVHHQIGIMCHDDDLPVKFDFAEKRNKLAHDKVIIKVVLWLIENKWRTKRIGRQLQANVERSALSSRQLLNRFSFVFKLGPHRQIAADVFGAAEEALQGVGSLIVEILGPPKKGLKRNLISGFLGKLDDGITRTSATKSSMLLTPRT